MTRGIALLTWTLLVATACSAPEVVAPTSATVALSATPTAAASPSATPTLIRPTPTPVPSEPPQPTATPMAILAGNDTRQPVYLYNSPLTGDRSQSYPAGTPLLIIGNDVVGDGLTWHYVRAPDGTEGYIPVGDTSPVPQ